MRSKFRATFATAAAAAMVLGTTALAVADDVDITSSTPIATVADDSYLTITIDVGQTALVELTYIETNPVQLSNGKGGPVWSPGLPGCELKGAPGVKPEDTQLVLGVNAQTPNVVTVDETVTFADCPEEIDGLAVSETRTLSVTGSSAGETLVSFDVDDATYAAPGAFFIVPDTIRVIVNGDEGRGAPAVANEYLGSLSDADLHACKSLNGTNPTQDNWRGQIINEVAQEFEGQTFTAETEYIVTDFIDSLCTSPE